MKTLFPLFLLLCLGVANAQTHLSALLPMPNEVRSIGGKPFSISTPGTGVYINTDELRFAAHSLRCLVKEQMGMDIPLDASPKSSIRLLVDPSIQERERYKIHIDDKEIVIKGATVAGVYYGVMTLGQLMIGDVCATLQQRLSPVWVDDVPRFSYRALMLDPARHFLPVEDVKFFIDQMSRYKYNVLQLHLTDDQGWRVEVTKHPELTKEAHYTQSQMRDLIRYAAERNVEIVPELDIPGHTVAVLAAYPELGCARLDRDSTKKVGVTNDLMVCANNERVYQVYKDIIGEMATLFPSRYIHLGGDEAVIEKNWAKCERCRALMKELGYEKASRLMIPFFARMLGFVREGGKEPVLWCELDNVYPPANDYLFPYPKNATLVTWRMGLTPTCLDLTAQHGNPIIMAPGEFAYLDYPQLKGDLPEFNNWGMPVTTLEKCYQFDPGYGRPASEQKHILGVMGTLWGEAMLDINRVTYMAFPRGLALAEAGWTRMEHRSWESFKERMYPNLMYLMKRGVSVRVPFEVEALI